MSNLFSSMDHSLVLIRTKKFVVNGDYLYTFLDLVDSQFRIMKRCFGNLLSIKISLDYPPRKKMKSWFVHGYATSPSNFCHIYVQCFSKQRTDDKKMCIPNLAKLIASLNCFGHVNLGSHVECQACLLCLNCATWCLRIFFVLKKYKYIYIYIYQYHNFFFFLICYFVILTN